jgi:hypothetical protein
MNKSGQLAAGNKLILKYCLGGLLGFTAAIIDPFSI